MKISSGVLDFSQAKRPTVVPRVFKRDSSGTLKYLEEK
jgi:hypothetical protein